VIENISYIIQQLYFCSYKYITLYFSVVDIYQEWAGPCRSVEGNFKRIKYEIEDPLLKFALVIIVSYRIYISTICCPIYTQIHIAIYIYIPFIITYTPFLHIVCTFILF